MLRDMRNKKNYIFLLLFFIGSSCVIFISIRHRQSQIVTFKEDVVYYSTLCGCNRTIPVESFKNETGIHWCSEESSLRGSNQNVVSYSVYGNAGSDPDSNRYYRLINTIPKQVQHYYPSKSLTAYQPMPYHSIAREKLYILSVGLKIIGPSVRPQTYRKDDLSFNLHISFKLTSDWRVRYYHGLEEDKQKERQILCNAYCNYSNVDLCDVNEIIRSLPAYDTVQIELPVLSNELAAFNKMNWRYLPMLDQHVDRMLARDTDSEINSREAAAVHEWLESNYTFHVMRDHPDHKLPIMGGICT